MDRNSIIGFGLLLVLLVAYVIFNNQQQTKFNEQKRADSIANAAAHPRAVKPDTVATATTLNTAPIADSNAMIPTQGVVETTVLENKNIAITLSNKGAQPLSAQIKGFKTYEGDSLFLFQSKQDQLYIQLPEKNGALATSDLFFTASKPDANSVVYHSDLGEGKSVKMTYTLPDSGYMMSVAIQLNGMEANSFPMTWKINGLHTEKDIELERQSSQVYYKQQDGEEDYYTIREEKDEKVDNAVRWLGYRQLYFSSALIAKNNAFNSVTMKNSPESKDSNVVTQNKFVFDLPASGSNSQFNFDWYIGPNDFKILKTYNEGLEEMVPLGYGVFTFVKYINKYFISPVFYFLAKYVSNLGVVIMLLTVIIRLLLSFFTYKSYLSAAKMRVLKPELDELRERLGGDQQKMGVEQMKLYRTAGVNPLGGCLPSLLQLPILLALYYFIPTAIELRGQSFLWATDLSTYDSIYNFPNGFTIPFYGNHVSFFTLLMTASSLFLALYNKNMSADPNNPMMKYMPYVFPFMLIGIFNKMAAALTFYYFFSNMISILQQWVIKEFIIDEDKIHAQIQENKNKPATPSKWQQKLEEMQKVQQQKMKQQPHRKK